jgi:cytoplasmic iron level regulating protein YaaA (DUF328/UPF0246 family)
MENKLSFNDKIIALSKTIDWSSLKNKKKLLIIACSDTKNPGGIPVCTNDLFQSLNLPDLINNRQIRFGQYDNLLYNKPDEYFDKKRNGLPVNRNYFNNCRKANVFYMPAYQRYSGKNFYSEGLKLRYLEKIELDDLHILIISGLYGVLEFKDSIIDYQLEIDESTFWTKNKNLSIQEAVKKYIKVNSIDNEFVFYSLSGQYKKALKPIQEWNDIWIKHDRGACSASFLEYFLDSI